MSTISLEKKKLSTLIQKLVGKIIYDPQPYNKIHPQKLNWFTKTYKSL